MSSLPFSEKKKKIIKCYQQLAVMTDELINFITLWVYLAENKFIFSYFVPRKKALTVHANCLQFA